MFVHIKFKNTFRSLSETVEKFSVTIAVEVDADPMLASPPRGVRVDDDHSRTYVDIGQFVAGEYSAVYRTVFPQDSIDDVAIHSIGVVDKHLFLAIYLDDRFELCVHDDVHGVRQRPRKL